MCKDRSMLVAIWLSMAIMSIASGAVFAQAPAGDSAVPASNSTRDAASNIRDAASDITASDITEPGEDAGSKGFTKYDALLASLTIFVLAVFVGFEVITKVPPTLHTPLMSGSNAISGITIVGALLATGYGGNWFVSLVGMVALVLASVNVVGGFLVTHRMLEMFKKK